MTAQQTATNLQEQQQLKLAKEQQNAANIHDQQQLQTAQKMVIQEANALEEQRIRLQQEELIFRAQQQEFQSRLHEQANAAMAKAEDQDLPATQPYQQEEVTPSSTSPTRTAQASAKRRSGSNYRSDGN